MKPASATGRSAWPSVVLRGAVALALAVGLNVLIRIVATELLSVDDGYEHLAWRAFIFTTVGVVVLAVLLRIGLTRYGDRAPRIFATVAIVVFVLSLGGPASLLVSDEAADGGIVTALALMHVATALAVWFVLARRVEP